MKVFQKIKNTVVRVWHVPFVKYGVIIVIGVVMVGFVSENSLLAHLRNKQYISTLSEEIEKYNDRYEKDVIKIRELNRNPKAMERIAREHYFMKADDEDIFVLSDDTREPQMNLMGDERAE